jgi:hypothetical protein
MMIRFLLGITGVLALYVLLLHLWNLWKQTSDD